jgi:hypothetical protein
MLCQSAEGMVWKRLMGLSSSMLSLCRSHASLSLWLSRLKLRNDGCFSTSLTRPASSSSSISSSQSRGVGSRFSSMFDPSDCVEPHAGVRRSTASGRLPRSNFSRGWKPCYVTLELIMDAPIQNCWQVSHQFSQLLITQSDPFLQPVKRWLELLLCTQSAHFWKPSRQFNRLFLISTKSLLKPITNYQSPIKWFTSGHRVIFEARRGKQGHLVRGV